MGSWNGRGEGLLNTLWEGGGGGALPAWGAGGEGGGSSRTFPSLEVKSSLAGLRSRLFLFGTLLSGIRFRTTCESTGAWWISRKKVTSVVCLVHGLCPRIVLFFAYA
jgi:hypothetical protein